MYLSSMGHTRTYPNCVVVSSLSSGLCIYGVSKLGAWNLGQWGLASWNDNAILSIYCQRWNRFGHLMPFELGAGEPCNTAGTQPRWWTTTWWNAWKKNMHDFIAPKYIINLNNIYHAKSPLLPGQCMAWFSRGMLSGAPSPFFAGKCELESGWKICMM